MTSNVDDCEIEETTIAIESVDNEEVEAVEEALEEVVEETPEEKLEKLMAFIYAQPMQREVMYRILNFCTERRLLPEIEEFIMSRAEYRADRISPYFMIEELRTQGALICVELDENGNDITEADKEGLDEDEIDDLIVDFAYELTEVGRMAADKSSPRARFAELTGARKEHVQAYLKVMEYLTEKRGVTSIDMYLHNWRNNAGAGVDIASGTIIDKLEKAGIINWQKGWSLTEEGKELLLELAE